MKSAKENVYLKNHSDLFIRQKIVAPKATKIPSDPLLTYTYTHHPLRGKVCMKILRKNLCFRQRFEKCSFVRTLYRTYTVLRVRGGNLADKFYADKCHEDKCHADKCHADKCHAHNAQYLGPCTRARIE